MIFQTERLQVRPFCSADWNDFYQMNADPAVKQYIADGRVNLLEQERADFEYFLTDKNQTHGLGVWAVVLKENQTLIGAGSLTRLQETGEIQIGYRFRRACWGQGFATEIAKGLVDYGFLILGLQRLVATTNRDNYGSMNVLRKVGFQFEEEIVCDNWPMNYFAITH